ncbi:uncharacterized protein K452DRAFT_27918 [Aplosporella prunicola CBS 121167]|uniref:Uncharacterized protein n=1 Tax=Aplosporella prunicola CBS 121167 TaxID=1176127 RepID=A0A6A6BFM1_9PEZI|nr:uncharacterized protein K452DRAFT_27918 [Aplosporella prunicola CBS 121167]KAF2142183.1 hypothetical protein K452DRAFT_27918 [Aplosporella prunicola CBS 121167]
MLTLGLRLPRSRLLLLGRLALHIVLVGSTLLTTLLRSSGGDGKRSAAFSVGSVPDLLHGVAEADFETVLGCRSHLRCSAIPVNLKSCQSRPTCDPCCKKSTYVVRSVVVQETANQSRLLTLAKALNEVLAEACSHDDGWKVSWLLSEQERREKE